MSSLNFTDRQLWADTGLAEMIMLFFKQNKLFSYWTKFISPKGILLSSLGLLPITDFNVTTDRRPFPIK